MLSLDNLCQNESVFDFLNRFAKEDVVDAVVLALDYAVSSIREKHKLADSLDLQQLKILCGISEQKESLHSHDNAVEGALPKLERTLKSVQDELSRVRASMEPKLSSQDTKCLESSSPAPEASNNAKLAAKPPSEWRRGRYGAQGSKELRAQYARQTVHGIGLEDSGGSVENVITGSGHQESTPALPKRHVSKHSVSLPSRRPAKPRHGSSGVDMVPTKQKRDPGAQTHRHKTVGVAHSLCNVKFPLQGRPSRRRRVPSYLKNVQSKIKRKVEIDRNSALNRKRAQRSAMLNAARNGVNDVDDFKVPPGDNQGRQAPGSVMAIAETFFQNPLMSPFAGPRKDTDSYNFEASRVGASRLWNRAPESIVDLSAGLSRWVSNKDAPSECSQRAREPSVSPSSYSWAQGITETTQGSGTPSPSLEPEDHTPSSRPSRSSEPRKDPFTAAPQRRRQDEFDLHGKEEIDDVKQRDSRPEISDYLGDLGASHTWTVPEAESGDDDDNFGKTPSPFRGTPGSVEWNFDRIVLQ